MKTLAKRIAAIFMILVLSLGLCIIPHAEETPATREGITVLFTNDLHSHLLPAVNEDGVGEYGGYARLMNRIREQKALAPDAILVDGGDFSMGSLFQTAYPTSAIELRMMGAMGYDVTTFGNHEYDYLQSGLISMLNAATASGDRLPDIVCSNYMPPVEGEEGYDPAMWEALENYGENGVRDYVILERGGVYFAIFGLFGIDADDCAPNSGMVFEDMASTAQDVVNTAVNECESLYGQHPVVICLSHSGTDDERQGEDYELANAVDGIDVIVSGHTHTTLHEPIRVGNTYIVSAGEYARYLGRITLLPEGDHFVMTSYELIPVDESVEDDPAIAALVESYKGEVEANYLSKYGFTFDQVLVENHITFDTVDEVYDTQHESTLGNLYSDAYKAAVEKVTGKRVTAALTASGVIRGSMPIGSVTVSDVFNAASLGVGTEGELIGIYLTGKDLKNAMEVDASVQPLMSSAQLFMSGVEYSFNTNRMIFNKVDYAMIRNDDGSLSEIHDDELYFVVAGMYMGQMLGSVEETSFGLLSITPRDEHGDPIATEDLVNFVVRDENGNPLKEWYAIATYLEDMDGHMDESYAYTDGRKVVYESWSPDTLLRNANAFTYVAMVLILILAVVFLPLILLLLPVALILWLLGFRIF